MKIFKTLVVLLFFIMPFLANSQNGKVVENVKWEFSSLKMVITYDLISPDGKSRTYDIALEVEAGGKTINPNSGIIGIGKQIAQNGKSIEWYFTRMGKTEDELDVDDLAVRVIATNPYPPIDVVKKDPPPIVNERKINTKPKEAKTVKLNKKPSLLLPSIATGAGVGLVVYGFVVEGEAKDLYKIYETKSIEQGMDLDAEYDTANNKHKTAQYLQIGGGVLTGVGAYLLYRTITKRKSAASGGFTVIPTLDDAPLYGSYGGVGVRYSF